MTGATLIVMAEVAVLMVARTWYVSQHVLFAFCRYVKFAYFFYDRIKPMIAVATVEDHQPLEVVVDIHPMSLLTGHLQRAMIIH